MPKINPVKYAETYAAKNTPSGQAVESAKKQIEEKIAKEAKEIGETYKAVHGPVNGAAKKIQADEYVQSLRAQLGF